MTNEEAFEKFILSDDWQEIRLHTQNSDELAENVWQAAIEFSNSEASKMRQPLKRLSDEQVELIATNDMFWEANGFSSPKLKWDEFANAIMDAMQEINK